MENKVIIIAEAGVNHNGKLTYAKQLIDIAVEAGADIVKFQTFKAANLVDYRAPKAEYQLHNTQKEESQLEMIKKFELTYKDHLELIDYCQRKKIDFLSSPFDLPSIDLIKKLGLKIFKIPSGEITNLPYLRKIGSVGVKVILSSGMSDMKEIELAINILINSGTKKSNITVLQCNTEYPTPFEDVNLNAMLTIKEKLGVEVGYSDHTVGIDIPIAATALGATIIEKHFTINKKMEGPDHNASLEPAELKQMVTSIRHIEAAMGNGLKKPSPSEIKNIRIVRKSIFINRTLPKGHILSSSDLIMKRPGTGISPMDMDTIIGKKITQNLPKDELLLWSHIK